MGNVTEIEKVYDWGKEAVSHCSVVTGLLLKLMKVWTTGATATQFCDRSYCQ